MTDADAFAHTAYLGLARRSRPDPYRLGLFAKHLEAGERARALLAVQGGTLLVTDRRILEMRPHLEVHGAWNVKEFLGYEVLRGTTRASVSAVSHRVEPGEGRNVLDRLLLATRDGPIEVLVSRGPEPTLLEEDFALLRDAILGPQAT